MTAIFPVKTLDSLTVVATPAAPTCLVGGTTSVALVVTAHYLTGTATSEAVVTTYTTGSNWANGVFTAATTVAGTENIVVSYTEGGVTKTANVAVTVSVEAPVVTTVTVTLPSTMTEASATQAVVLVKDQFGATMTTGFTTTYAITTGTSTSTTAGLVTAGSYDANTAANNAHILTVTATPTTGTAVTGTASFTVTADTTKPTIVSVQAIDNKNIVVTYSKKVSSTATTVTNYSLYHGTTGVTAPLNTAAAANKIYATALFTDSTNKVVKITIVTVDSALSGYPAGGLDAVNYRLYVSNVTDTTSNANTIIASSNTQFLGTTTPDSNKPVINAIAYNKGTGILVVTLDKAVTNALVYTNIKFNGTVLTAAVTNNAQASGEENKISVTLASADKTTVAALTGDITVTILVDAIADANGNKNVETSMVATLTVPPTMTGAVYDEATNTLSMGFSQTLDLSTSTLRAKFTDGASFQMKSTEFSAVALNSSDTLITTSNAATVSVLLSNDHANAFEAISAHTSPKVLVAVNAFKNTTGDYNIKADDSTTEYPAPAMTVVKDTEKPAITSITYDETTKKLVLNFNVNVSRTFTGANVLFFNDKDTKTAFATTTSLNGLTPTEVSDGKTLTFDLSVAGAAAGIATDLKSAQQGPTTLTTPATYNSFVTFVADTFTKSGSLLKNVAVTDKAAATTVTYTDNVAPALSSAAITVTNQATISFVFDEKVNKTDAETAANYKIYLGATTTTLAVNSVKMTDYEASTPNYAQKTVQIVTGTQTSGQTYRLVVSNVKDLAGNVISSTDAAKYSKEFTGSSTAAPSPKVVSAKIRDNGNQSLDTADYIAVTFDRPVKLNTSSTQTVNQNFDLTLGTADFPASYNKSYVTMSTDTADLDCVVLIKVDSAMVSGGASPVTVGQDKIDVLGGDLIKDKYSDVAAAAGTAVVIQSPLGATTITEALLTDVDGSGTINKGDTLKVTFSNPLYVVAGTIAASNVITENARSLGTNPTISTTMTTSVSSNTLTVTLDAGTTLLPTDIKAGEDINITDQFLKDSWGIKVASTVVKAITTATVAAPYITKVEWVDTFGVSGGNVTAGADGAGNTGDYLYVTFNVPVYINAPTTANMWAFGGSALAQNLYNAQKNVSDNKVIRIQLGNGTGNIAVGQPSVAQTLTPTVTTVEVTPANMLANITNFSGDSVVAATTTVKVTVPSDITAPTITSAEIIANDKVKVIFSEAVNVSNIDVSKIDFVGSATLNSAAAGNVAVDSNDSTGKTVIFTTSASFTIGEQTSGIAASTSTGLLIEAANKITDLAGNALAATAAGASYLAISKDVTAPDNVTLAYGLNTYKANLALTNAAGTGKVDNSVGTAIQYGELALLEVFIGASTPAAETTATKSAVAYATNAGASATDLITAIPMATTGHKIFYRLLDRAGNKSAWLDSGNTVTAATLANATYTKKTASSTTANDAYLSSNTLYVGDGTTTQAYDVTNNATVKSIMTNLAASDTFTIASGKVNAFTAANLTADASVALTTADLAATVTVTGDAASKLTLTGTGPSTKLVLAAANGGYTVSATAIPAVDVAASTGTITISAAVPTVTLTGAVANLSVGANVSTALALGANNITTKLTITAGTVADVTGAGTIAALDLNGGTLTAYNGGLITNLTLNGGTLTTITKAKMTNLIIGTNSASATALSATVTGGVGAWTIQALESTAATSATPGNVTATWTSATNIALAWAADNAGTNVTFTGNDATVVATTAGGANVSQLVITKP